MIVPLGGGRVAVPDNRWDLAPAMPDQQPAVSVVIPYYRQPRQLEQVLLALDRQTYPAHLIDVVVADDGSPEPPSTRGRPRTTVVRQEDNGFRAAAARNLGAAAAVGSILCFLDADTVPEPDYLTRITALPAVVPDAVTVGRRRHADLSQWSPADGRPRVVLEEPRWLIDAYESSRDLLDADWRSYRHVISAVMCCSRALFDDIGGFDESFQGYGGEDWEFANRAFVFGAVLAHVPGAVAWHDGPDWAGRDVDDCARADQKTAEALTLSPRITEPGARRHGVTYATPDTIVVVDSRRHTAGSLLVTVGSLLRNLDCRIWVEHGKTLLDQLDLDDSRVSSGRPGPGNYRTSRFVLHVDARVEFDAGSLTSMFGAVSPGGVGRVRCQWDDGSAVELRSRRSTMRAQRWAESTGRSAETLADDLFGTWRPEPAELSLELGPRHADLSW